MRLKSRTLCVPIEYPKFERAGSNDEVAHRQGYAARSLFATDAGDDLRRDIRYRMAWHCRFQLVKKTLPPLSELGVVSPIDSVADFGDGEHGQNNRHFANRSLNTFDRLRGGKSTAFSRNQDA